MSPKLPLPRGWKRPVRWSVLHILALSYHTPVAIANVLNSTKNMLFPGRPVSLDQFTTAEAKKGAATLGHRPHG
jgi:hypothetical protein